MSNTNLFEKFGIKEVADVTFYRIERKNETYESQRNISASSILKGMIELKTVYPMENGMGAEDGFEAYVFSDAEIITGRNYNCDDTIVVREVYTTTVVKDTVGEIESLDNSIFTRDGLKTNSIDDVTVKNTLILNKETKRELTEAEVAKYTKQTEISDSKKVQKLGTTTETEDNKYEATFLITFEVTYSDVAESTTKFDAPTYPGTHEYSYEQQALMLFAKNQNLIDKTGARYQFSGTDSVFGELVFEDNFAVAPKSTQKVVVLGLSGRISESEYDKTEIQEVIKNLSTSIAAKAYNVTYSDFAELIVEDEMGYYRPACLGSGYTTRENDYTIVPFTESDTYEAWANAKKGADIAIATAEMWGKDEHDSINDAIEALRQKKATLDVGMESAVAGIEEVYGGYKVTDNVPFNAGQSDLAPTEYKYNYSVGGAIGSTEKSNFTLDKVLEALNKIALTENVEEQNVEVGVDGAGKSNRAIYVRAEGLTSVSASAYIYLLTNKNAKKLSNDKSGVFWFNDKKGNKVYYQDPIFAGVEYLALVIIGNKGMIFKVGRCGTKSIEKIAWMVNESGYITDSQAKTIVSNGIIHTIDVTDGEESFEATCTVNSIKVRTTAKTVNRYVPVLFLDTLKVSTLEQTAEQTSANGGKGNGQLIIWDLTNAIGPLKCNA